MPVKRKGGKARIGAIPELEWSILTDQLDPESVPGWEGFLAQYFQPPGSLATPSLGDYWTSHGDAVTADWIEQHPGTRPSFWWKFSAPRWVEFDPEMATPRRQTGGSGWHDPSRSDRSRMDLIRYHLGIPETSEWRGVDWSDPPMIESQAAYLDRFGLILPAERRSLNKAAFLPERLDAPSN